MKEKIKELKEKVVKSITKEEVKKEERPGFDPDLPENKQRWLR